MGALCCAADQQSIHTERTCMSRDPAILRMEEYKSLRAEILERIREANTLILTTAGGIGGAYAVLVTAFAREPHLKFSHASFFVNSCFLLIIWAPVLFALLAHIKSREIWDMVSELAGYVRIIEEIEYEPAVPRSGWEHRMVRLREQSTGVFRWFNRPPYPGIYRIMLGLTFGVAVIPTVHIIVLTAPKLIASLW
jgi:hypothetical protein